MKTFAFLIVASVMFMGTSCSSVKSTPETIDQITKQVEGRDYTINVRMANPMRGKAIPLSHTYELRVKGDSAYAYLPYYGVAQWAPYGSTDGGIKFDEPMKNYTITTNKKKNGWDISFEVDTKDYNYDFMVNIFNNGTSSIIVNSTDRDMISFNGEVVK